MKEKIRHLVIGAEVLVLIGLCISLVKNGNAQRVTVQSQIEEKTDKISNTSDYEKDNKKIIDIKGIGMKDIEGKENEEEDLEEINCKENNFKEKKRVALTFDDGPSSKYTPQLLEGLRERGVHATFFLMGKNIEGNEELVKQIQEEGHLIGNHTYNHVELDKIPKEKALEEIEAANQEIYEITGVYPQWLRPPYGAWVKNLDFCVEMFPVLWDVDTLDWKSKNVESILKIAKAEVKDGAVILMHDAYQSSVEAALQIVDLLTAKGYEFVTVDELILP
ncbi:polysaccharide deacetylase family protein [Blautia sp. HCP3S3_H10_1]|uniref:polysaccharide deacetylase family protein n=1 Tax=unclassified Blautia TaxID=2648079 RepID=UPI003F9097AA|nr:polysaccharide deacetylase family protein [Clostridia bacterium]